MLENARIISKIVFLLSYLIVTVPKKVQPQDIPEKHLYVAY